MTKLTIDTLTKEFLRLMISYHNLNAEFIPTPKDAKIGSIAEITDQKNVIVGDVGPAFLESQEFELSLDDFSRKWLGYFANQLGAILKFDEIKTTHQLVLPNSNSIQASYNHRYNGIQCRGLLYYRIQSDSWIVRFDVLYGK